MKSDDRGRSVRRFEDFRFLTGGGRYVEDFALPGQVHAHVLRSPHAHASIERLDVAAARDAGGVLGVFTEADLRADGVGPLPCIAQVSTVDPMIVPPRYALARGRVRHVGDPVALVVAENRDQARDAAERIAVEYRPLDAVVDAAAALLAGAPTIWDEAPGNLCFRFQRGDRDAAGAAFARAAHSVEIEHVNNRLVPAPIEPRAAIGNYDAAADRLDLLLTGQGVHSIRNQLAEAVFRLPPERIQLAAPDVGGGFGMKNFLYPEWVLVLWAARRLGRPVKWVASGVRNSSAVRRAATTIRKLVSRSTRTAGFSRSTSPPWPISAPICRRTDRAARPIRRQPRWAASTRSRPSSWMYAAPSPTRCRSTPIAAPASPRRII